VTSAVLPERENMAPGMGTEGERDERRAQLRCERLLDQLADQVLDAQVDLLRAVRALGRDHQGDVGTLAQRAAVTGRERQDRDLLRTQERLSDLLGTTVALKMSSRGKGRIVIDFSDLEQFDGLLQRMRLSLQDD